MDVSDTMKLAYLQSKEQSIHECRRILEHHMPAMNLEPALRSKFELGLITGVHRMPSKRGTQIVSGYVRLVDKATLEYANARERLLLFLDNGNPDNFHRAQDYFENCITSMHRAILFLDRIRGRGFKNADGTSFVPKPRELEVLRDSAKKCIRDFRNTTQHIDEDILKETLPENAGVDIGLTEQAAYVGQCEIIYSNLFKWIGQLHHFAQLLSRVQIVVCNPS
jgi:hypothetical protein